VHSATKSPQYAVVAYVRNRLGKFVEDLRSELYPEHAHLPAHVTILPPRPLCGTEQEAIATLEQGAKSFRPFDIELAGIETFAPTTPTVFIRVARAAHLFREMHDRFNIGPFNCQEIWTYIPHLTIVKMPTLEQSQAALVTARERWRTYVGSRICPVEELTFVREGESNHWIDLATVKLRG
jgi:2'-5' RNA ligase